MYNLYLRIRCYPHSIDDIKCDFTCTLLAFIEHCRKSTTKHELYLQLRRDIIDEALHTSRETAYELAALAMQVLKRQFLYPLTHNKLQAECSDRPSSEATDYFQPDHFLPNRHLAVDRADERMRQILAELHSQYAGLSRVEAEEEFIKVELYLHKETNQCIIVEVSRTT